MLSCPKSIQDQLEALVEKKVPRETFSQLERYLYLLKQENEKYNLVGPREIDRLWERHVLDSAQLFPFLKNSPSFLDVGTGAGFPGVVLSILEAPGGVLVESSQKKCAFLEMVSRETSGSFSVLNVRIENLKGVSFDRIVSRAVAPIETLLSWARGVSSSRTMFFFLKGRMAEKEVEVAEKTFSFQVEMFPSLTCAEGKIVKIQNLCDSPRGVVFFEGSGYKEIWEK